MLLAYDSASCTGVGRSLPLLSDSSRASVMQPAHPSRFEGIGDSPYIHPADNNTPTILR